MLKSKTGSRAQGVERASEIIDFIFSTGRETGGVTGTMISSEDARTKMDRCHLQYLAKPSDFITLLCCYGWLRGKLHISHPWIISLLLHSCHLALSHAPFFKSVHAYVSSVPLPVKVLSFRLVCTSLCESKGVHYIEKLVLFCAGFRISSSSSSLSASFYSPL